MTDERVRYDRMAAGYGRWWAPVLAPSAVALLDRLDPVLSSPGVASGHRASARIVDIGTGTGNLALAALRRWPNVHVTGIDASREMLGALEAAMEARPADESSRFDGHVAYAAELPFPDATFDVAMSSFVLQLVPNRARALREIRRVLRPGGTLGYVTWLADKTAFAPDRIFDGLLTEFGYDEDDGHDRCRDVPSVPTGAAELHRAGFRDVTATQGRLEHAYTVESYMAFMVEFDEESLFYEMSRAERRRFLARLREGLMSVPPDALVFRAPIIYAMGRRSDG